MQKKWIYPVGLIVVALLAFYGYRKYHVAPGIDLKALELVDLDGNPVTVEALRGKKTVLAFGASWCGNCRVELGEIADVKETDLKDVEIVVISDEPIEKVRAFGARKGYPFTYVKMNRPFSAIGIHSIPTTYFVSSDFKIVKETVGYINWKDPSTVQHLVKLME